MSHEATENVLKRRFLNCDQETQHLDDKTSGAEVTPPDTVQNRQWRK